MQRFFHIWETKGANVGMMKELDENLQHYANMLKRYVSFDVSEIPGAGAWRNGEQVISVLKGDLRRALKLY